MHRLARYITLLTIAAGLSNATAFGQELSPVEEVTQFLEGKVWVNNMTCYGDTCRKNRRYDSYYYWDGSLQEYVKDSILFYSFELSSIGIDGNGRYKTAFINGCPPLIVVLSKDEQDFPTYNCLYKSENFSGFVELKTNRNEFVLKGLFNDDATIVTMQYKRTSPPPRIKEIIKRNSNQE